MKTKIIWILIISLVLAVASSSAQEFTFTTSAANITAAMARITDPPSLAGNLQAIIVATPLGTTQTSIRHPIGAWYYNGKWHIFNTDNSTMSVGLSFKLEVYLTPGANQFLHIINNSNLASGSSYIDHPLLNTKPNAQFKILQNFAPDYRTGLRNPNEAAVFYDSTIGKWYIKNVNGLPLNATTAYNIVVSSGGAIGSNTSTPSSAPPPTTTTVINPAPTIPTAIPTVTNPPMGPITPASGAQTQKPIELTFDNLNDFVVKGLPASAVLPSGTIDQVAAFAAKQISRSDDGSLPILLPALQAAGFTIIDKNGKVLFKPADGKGQGLGFYDFEAVGSLKLAQKGVLISLEGLAATITKQTPAISATQFADLMLKELRLHANDQNNSYLRFYARLIIELGKASVEPVDLMTAPAGQIKLSVLQASLLIRRLQGTFYALAKRTGSTEISPPRFLQHGPYISAFWKRDDSPLFPRPVMKDSPCNLTGDQALILDSAAIHLTTWNGTIVAAFDSPRLGAGIQGANAALAWLKLVASVTMMKGQIHVQEDPLVRTLNSDTSKLSNKRLMVARIWSEVGDVEVLNCLRPSLNLLTGLDFNLPTGGPLGDVAIEWHFAGDNDIRVNNSSTRNTESFVVFESAKGNDPNPQKQVTDDKGLSKMWLVGKAKVPAIRFENNPATVDKEAEVYVAVTLKSAKDFKQNVLDFSGFILGVAQAIKGGDIVALGGVLIGAGAEIGYRTPYVAARATIPVIDHEPCDGQWVGTVTYTVIRTYKHTITYPARITPNSGGTGYFGGSTTTDQTVTLSGTATVNSKDGQRSLITSSADEIMSMKTSHSSAGYCNKKMGVRNDDANSTDIKNASGTMRGTTTVYITFFKDFYQISLKPIDVNATLKSSSESSHTGCNPGANSYNNSSIALYGGVLINGKADIGDDPGILKGSTTTTTNVNDDGNTVTTITWNLRRCN